jgi:hypothetical protein
MARREPTSFPISRSRTTAFGICHINSASRHSRNRSSRITSAAGKSRKRFHANAIEAGDHIFKWLVLPDGDLLCPQGIDWAERDVQHSWGFTVLGTLLDQSWARAADARCSEAADEASGRVW